MLGGLDVTGWASMSPSQWMLTGLALLTLLWLLGCRVRVDQARRAVDAAWQHWLTQQAHKLQTVNGLSGPNDAQPSSALWQRVQAVSKQYALFLQDLTAPPVRKRSWRQCPSAASQAVLLHEHLFRTAMQGWLDSAGPASPSAPVATPASAPAAAPQDAADREASAVERLLHSSHPMLHTVLHLESEARQIYSAAAAHYNQQRRIGPTRAIAGLMLWPEAQTLPEGLLRVELTPPVSAELS